MKAIIKAATEPIILDTDNFKAIEEGIRELYNIYAGITGIEAKDVNDNNDIYTPFGKAISPVKAAHCLLEIKRTATFVRGIYKAILQLREDFPGQRIYILYAGCGPYASLLTPLTAFFTEAELGFYMLDVNQTSLTAVKKLYNELQLNGYLTEMICADATAYDLDKNKPVHLIVSETMQQGLMKEPQVAIMQHLIPQLPAKGIFIPEKITVSAALLNFKIETDSFFEAGKIPDRVQLGVLYSIGQTNMEPSRPVTIKIPGELSGFNSLNMLTHITVYGTEVLTNYDCSLNMPLKIVDAGLYKGRDMVFNYVISNNPGFEYEVL